MLSEKKKRKRKMWSKKWYLKRNISCDDYLLSELLEAEVPWEDAIVVSAGKLRKLWDSLSRLRSSVWKTFGQDSSEACAIACQNFAVYSVFLSGMTSHSKIAQFNWECTACFSLKQQIRPAFRGPFGRTQHVSCVLLKWLLKALTTSHGFGVKRKFNNMIIPITTLDQDMIQWQTTISTQQTKL